MKRTVLTSVVGLSVIALIIGLWSYSRAEGDTITICAKKSGLAYVIGNGFRREDCGENESLLTWNIQGIQGPKGDKGDQGDPGLQGESGPMGPQGPSGINAQTLHLVDNNGQDLGILIEKTMTYLSSLDVFVTFNSWFDYTGSGNIKVENDISTLWFEGPNCSGQAFWSNTFHYQKVFRISNGVYFRYFKTRKDDVPISRTRESRFYGSGCENGQATYTLTYAYDEISLPFTEPLAGPLRIGNK